MTSRTESTSDIRIQHITLANGMQLEVAEHGDRAGPGLLLLHGITDSWRSFEPVLAHLPPQWRVIAPSQRGHGASHKPAVGYGTRDFAADTALLIETLQLAPVVLVGHSMGAANAMRLAAERPDLVRALVGAGAFASFGDKPDLADFVATTIAPLAGSVPRELAEEFQRSTLVQPVAETFVQAMVDQSMKVPAHVWRECFAGLLKDDFGVALHRIQAPVLLVHGAADAYVRAADVQTLQRVMPQARLETWAGAGHAMHWEEPQRFARSIVRFVNALPELRERAVLALPAMP